MRGGTRAEGQSPPDLAWELARVEYEQALAQDQNCTVLRRQDMAFVTTIQGAALTIVGTKLLRMDTAGVLLSLIAFFMLLLGLNSERRLTSYMDAYSRRARELEEQHRLSLVSCGLDETRGKRLLFSNSVMFPLYYAFLMVCWLVVWTRNALG